MSNIANYELLTAALAGYQHEHERIAAAIADLQRRLGNAAIAPNGSKPGRMLSAAARKRIAAAQKKRWAHYRAAQPKKLRTTAKRHLSPEARAKLAANLAKARAARAAKAAVA